MANKSLWKDEYLIDIYELAKGGAKEKTISKILGISPATFVVWERKKPLLRMVLEKGRKEFRIRKKKHGENVIADFVFNGLTPEMKKVWKRLNRADKVRGSKNVIDAILEGKGKPFRQHLFLYAFINGDYSLTGACKRVGISVRTFDVWKTEPEFQQLFKHVQECKKDFFETHLINLVRKGSEAATIFSMKTQVADRGYNEKSRIDVNVSGVVQHQAFPFEEIRQYLSSECQMEILEACRKRKMIESTTVPLLPLPKKSPVEAMWEAKARYKAERERKAKMEGESIEAVFEEKREEGEGRAKMEGEK